MGLLAPTWPHVSHYGHLGSELANGRSLCVSLLLCLLLSKPILCHLTVTTVIAVAVIVRVGARGSDPPPPRTMPPPSLPPPRGPCALTGSPRVVFASRDQACWHWSPPSTPTPPCPSRFASHAHCQVTPPLGTPAHTRQGSGVPCPTPNASLHPASLTRVLSLLQLGSVFSIRGGGTPVATTTDILATAVQQLACRA